MPIIGKGYVQSELELEARAAERAGENAAPDDARPEAQAAQPVRGRRGKRIPNSVGIVFVHGIGSQRPEEFLLQWSEPVLRTIEVWKRTVPPGDLVLGDRSGPDSVVRAEMDFEGETIPMITIQVPGDRGAASEGGRIPQTWVATEAWWAAAIQPPTLQAMIDWCGRQGTVGRIVSAILRQNGNYSTDTDQRLGRLGLGLFVSTLVSVVLLGWAAMRGLASLIPIAAVKDAVTAQQLETFLTTWWGDARVLLSDPAQSANIRGRLIRAIRALRHHGCQRIVVVGHSGGTIVATMALSDPAFGNVTVDTFISHGEAVNLGLHIIGRMSPDQQAEEMPVAARLVAPQLRAGRWRDFWASHDPAPCGGLEVPGASPVPAEDKVYNRRSIGEDHGTYWDNDEEFVIPVLREIETAGRARSSSRFYPPATWRPSPDETWADRRRQRVYLLALWNRLAFVATIGSILVALAVGGGLIPVFAGALGTVWSWLPGHEQVEQVAGLVRQPPPGVRSAVDVIGHAGLWAVAILALVQVLLPIRDWGETWGRQPVMDGVVRALDAGIPAVLVFGLAISPILRLVELLRAGAPLPLVATLVVLVVALFAIIQPGPVKSLADRYARFLNAHRTFKAFGAALLVGLLLLWVVTTAYLVVLDAAVRSVLMGAILVFAVFHVVRSVGVWRWQVADRAERDDARLNRLVPATRLWLYAESTLLLVVILLLAVAVAAGSLSLVGGLAIVLLVGVIIAVARDAEVEGSGQAEGVPNAAGGA